MKRIALFTNFHPDIGGGAAHLRSIIAEWGPEIDLTWYYLGKNVSKWPSSVRIGKNFVGGGVLKDFVITPFVLCGYYTSPLEFVVRRLLAVNYDCYWVVAMNEGLTVGNMLVKEGFRSKLHVSVQDDQYGWMWARSRRYKLQAPLFRNPLGKLLLAAKSVDVISDGMQQYYRKRIGLDSLVVHPYIGKLREPALGILNEWEVVVGHIGSVYDLTDFQSFLIATRRWALLKQKKFRLVLIGFSQQRLQALTAIPACEIRCIPNMPEAEAVKLLQTCDFVYAMYPFKESARVFRQTSLPTKLSTYIRAQRPIFAHTPADSSLAALVGKYELGVVASSLGDSELFQSLDAMDNPIPRKMFEITRREVYGWSNVESLRECLLNL